MADILDTQFEGKEVELVDNRVKLGDDINITAKDPTMHKLLVGVGWDLSVFNADALDLDVSIFMLGRDNITRVDEDFIFYNYPQSPEGGVKHNGDSRTGAGDGDDEAISLDLHNIPFDVLKVMFALTIYKGKEKGQNMGMVRNAYLRLVNQQSGIEILRYELTTDLEDKTETGMLVASLNREGPKWHFTPVAEFVDGGLSAIAKNYGITIVEQ